MRASVTLVVLLQVTVGCVAQTIGQRPSQLKLALITPPTGKLGFERVSAAATMAIDEAHADGILTGIDVRSVTLLLLNTHND